MIGMPPQTTAASKAHENPVRIHSIFLLRRPVTIHVSQKIRDYQTTTTKFLKLQQIIRASNPNKREHRYTGSESFERTARLGSMLGQ